MEQYDKCWPGAAPASCEDCLENIGANTDFQRVAGPCGQQHCWYSCFICMNSNFGRCPKEEEEFEED